MFRVFTNKSVILSSIVYASILSLLSSSLPINAHSTSLSMCVLVGTSVQLVDREGSWISSYGTNSPFGTFLTLKSLWYSLPFGSKIWGMNPPYLLGRTFRHGKCWYFIVFRSAPCFGSTPFKWYRWSSSSVFGCFCTVGDTLGWSCDFSSFWSNRRFVFSMPCLIFFTFWTVSCYLFLVC